MKKISIIVACYNAGKYLDRCWKSLKNQTIGIENLECIFVDDASTDAGETWNMLRQIESEAPESVVIIHLEENIRQGGARNVALEYASAKYLQFLDSDDELVENACERLYEIAEENNADIVQFDKLRILGIQHRKEKEYIYTGLYEIDSTDKRRAVLLTKVLTCGILNKFYNINVIKESCARFAERVVYEEPLFVYPLFFYAKRVYITDEVLYNYYMNEGSTVASLVGRRILDHPFVQLQVLEYCLEKEEMFALYRKEIEIYFLWTFFCETISFASMRDDALIPLSFFKDMQGICKTYFGDWRSNPYLPTMSADVIEVLKSIDIDFNNQEDLNSYIKVVGAII